MHVFPILSKIRVLQYIPYFRAQMLGFGFFFSGVLQKLQSPVAEAPTKTVSDCSALLIANLSGWKQTTELLNSWLVQLSQSRALK